jgi:C4-dicarboxylate-specific signal transduction histidine kinase
VRLYRQEITTRLSCRFNFLAIRDAAAARRWLNSTPPHPNKTLQSLAGITNDAQRAADVIARIRMLAKKSSIQTTQVDINGAITNVLALIRSELGLNRITVRTELEGELPAVEGDPVQLCNLSLASDLVAIHSPWNLRSGSQA